MASKATIAIGRSLPDYVRHLRFATRIAVIRSRPYITRLRAYSIAALPAAGWGLTAIFLGFVIGLAAIVLPPTGAFGIVAVAGLVLLWAIPDLPTVPDRIIRQTFLVMLVVDLCLPFYYMIQVAGLPWISARRVATFALILPFALAISGSSSVRRQIMARASSPLGVCAAGFLAMIILSIFTSINPPESMSGMSDAILGWYVPFLAAIFVIRSYGELLTFLRIICLCALFVAMAGVIEFFFQHRFFIDVFPKSVLSTMMAQNPSIAEFVNSSPYRNGLYRASSVFTGPLSLGEFNAIMFPIGLYLSLHCERWRDRVLGGAVVVLTLAGIVVAGSRGGYVALIVSAFAFTALWTLRKAKITKASLTPAIVTITGGLGFMILFALILFWPRAHALVFGDGMAAYSNDARLQQWILGVPKILSNPITGHGFALGATIIDFAFINRNGFTIDSYVLSLLVETGVPGFLFFSGMIVWPIWRGARNYLVDPSQHGALSGAMACSFLAFAVNRLVLSERGNHVLLFVLLGAFAVLNFIDATPRQSREEDIPSPARAGSATYRRPPGRPPSARS